METPNRATTDQVRQILMNELGLSREVIRVIMEQIITDTVNRHMAALEDSGKLDKIVEGAFERKYNSPSSCYETFASLVRDAAKNAADKFVREKIRFKGE
jgi:hypothetical protein